MSAQVVSANRLTDGRVVWLAEGHRWVEGFAAAAVANDADGAAALLAATAADVARAVVVGPYLVAVEAHEGAIRPATMRERIRADGPSVL